MIRAACAGLLILTACGSVVAQPVASMTAFDVASVKPDTVGSNEGPGRGREVIQTTPQNLTMRNIRLRSALQWACRPQTDQILGVTWLDAERYLILAKVGTPASAEQLRLMLQKLLIERFKLTLHRVTRELPAFVFAVDKSGPKFERSQEQVEGQEQVDGNMQYGKGNSVIGANATMSQFVDALTNPLHTVVLDEPVCTAAIASRSTSTSMNPVTSRRNICRRSSAAVCETSWASSWSRDSAR
ncbi:MAG: hypothetical protein JWP63_6506, partial [Candidatus Solibacter sp.]|nr:hypothetical protein [Candidatus Solibacter sp.]